MSTLSANETLLLQQSVKIENGVYKVPKKIQTLALELRRKYCPFSEKKEGFCKAIWDGIVCWPSVKANKTIELACPEYIDGFRVDGNASKTCDENGEWKIYPSLNFSHWTNYSLCTVEKGLCEKKIFVSEY
ncbi:unnamed protein product [Dimorphilus gyrociliatus]|uniref:G-protein coupled receptors family 2 profile 1 domain-containing protein n=1 Tax=Dimorphilus gyrociliatus TaxID=2664684 RepID=A0A7I8VNG5_9ANNE|nr:unnamed protein product [Dimorphilus gyrociliatus]